MKAGRWQWLRRMPDVLADAQAEREALSRRHSSRQLNILLPARLIVAGIVLNKIFSSRWQADVLNTYGVMVETIQHLCVAYTALIVAATVLFAVVRRFPAGTAQWLVFLLGLADGIFLGGLTVLTGGFESILYWVYPALIIVNAATIPLATPQIVLNLGLGIVFLSAGLLENSSEPDLDFGRSFRPAPRTNLEEVAETNALAAASWLSSAPAPFNKLTWDALPETVQSNLQQFVAAPTNPATVKESLAESAAILFPAPRYSFAPAPAPDLTEPSGTHYILQVAVLLLLTFCCYGVQVLVVAQRRAEEERHEFLVRTERLRSNGRLAAEVAHQIKNPLAIINNVTFSLQKNLGSEPPATRQQIEIIREEIAKADRIITQVMGYAQLTEGRVEKLNVIDEINRAIEEVFPDGVPTNLRIQRRFSNALPPLLLQRKHLTDSVSNLLQNARDASPAGSTIEVSATLAAPESIAISVSDEGPGIPPDRLERIFEAYYTTKSQGSGLGLAVVKNNTELYGGRVVVESKLGNGSKFTLFFPSKTLMKPIS